VVLFHSVTRADHLTYRLFPKNEQSKEPIMTNLVISGDYTDFSDESGPLGISIRSFSPIGTFSGMGSLDLEAREIIDVDNRSIEYFIVATVKPSDQYGREGVVIISYDDVGRTCAAIDRLKLSHPGVTKFKNFEIKFSTPSKFSITVFSQLRGGIGVSISADGSSMFLNDVRKLDDLKEALQKGANYIDENRIKNNF
jgi:hypothetical protein